MPSRQLPLLHPSPTFPLGAAVLLLFATVAASLLCLWPSRKWKRRPSNKTAPSSSPPSSPPEPQRYTYDSLRRATASFSSANKLGQGGFGPVFRGDLPSGDHVAIKIMDSASLQGEIEFRNELSISTSLMKSGDATHVIFPDGFCSEEDPEENNAKKSKRIDKKNRRRKKKKNRKPADWIDRMTNSVDEFGDGFGSSDDDLEEGATRRVLLLVYKLMPNGSLQDALLIRRRTELMEWPRRFIIALDVAHGLRFLHSECNPPIVHGDIKPSNVLLDSDFSAKIADFGLARMVDPSSDKGKGSTGGGFDLATGIGSSREMASSSDIGSGDTTKRNLMELIGSEKAAENCFSASDADGSLKTWKQRSLRLKWWASFDESRQRRKDGRMPLGELWRKELKRDELPNNDKIQDSNNRKHRRRQSWSRGSRQDVTSSTPSMRGTMCYAAPECGAEAMSSSDVYSFGVLLLVIVSGRRPLKVTASPTAEHASLITWARTLARKGRGRLADLVDESVRDVDREEVVRCVAVALLCLQRDPARRPSMIEVVEMLSGASEVRVEPRRSSQRDQHVRANGRSNGASREV